jgi:hypothetical protein
MATEQGRKERESKICVSVYQPLVVQGENVSEIQNDLGRYGRSNLSVI